MHFTFFNDVRYVDPVPAAAGFQFTPTNMAAIIAPTIAVLISLVIVVLIVVRENILSKVLIECLRYGL